jgi:hypothetical protein
VGTISSPLYIQLNTTYIVVIMNKVQVVQNSFEPKTLKYLLKKIEYVGFNQDSSEVSKIPSSKSKRYRNSPPKDIYGQ